ncbi:response regulator transcription factor [Paenibacillus sp. 1P07SE]|uniref:response regulator transcription factor n=1 Tax=Paenibacillus sp. 1P07SE TaxID=3132209 RepID=UPI0039A443C6
MYHLMIVDDEPLAVDYLAEALEDMPDLEFEIIKAYSGKDALNKLDSSKVDILLTDIRMPGMSGIELADEVFALRPRCRIIFLTGYNDFDYAQSAIRRGGVDYVLKTEGDEAVVRALKKAVQEIEAQVGEEQILQKARQQYHLALPSLRRDYLIECLQGEEESLQARQKRFAELTIDLDPEQPVLMALGLVDNWGTFQAPGDRVLLFYSIHNIAEEYFEPDLRMLPLQYDRTRVVWFVQPKPGQSMDVARSALNSCAERIQAACKSLLKVSLSLALAPDPTAWDDAGERIEALKLQLSFRMGSGEEMLVSMPQPEAGPAPRASAPMLELGRVRSRIHKLDLLEADMDNGREEAYRALFDQLFRFDEPVFAGDAGQWLGLELFSHLSAFFLSYMNKRELLQAMEGHIHPEKIYNPNAHAGWHEMIDFFRDLGAQVARHNSRKQDEHTHELIKKVHLYIDRFLHEELSLTKLAELVYLSPPYFSRLYKQMTGKGLLDYINDTRIQRAKLLLKTTDRKIQDIAAEVGLESPAYFTRLFRKKTGRTPQDYRESSKGMEAL